MAVVNVTAAAAISAASTDEPKTKKKDTRGSIEMQTATQNNTTINPSYSLSNKEPKWIMNNSYDFFPIHLIRY